MQTRHISIPISSPRPREAHRLKELKLWLRGFIHRPDFFTAQPLHHLHDLQKALALAITELTCHLEPRLELIIRTATDPDHNIQLKADDFDQDRKLDIDGLNEGGLDGIRCMGRQAVVKCLVLARDEIEWVDNEAKRLEVHAQNAEEQMKCKYRLSFEYHPAPRKIKGPADWAIGDVKEEEDVVEVKEENVVYPKDEELLVEESEDEILDESEDGDVEDERRDSLDIAPWGVPKVESPQ